MKLSDIQAVAYGLRDAKPGAYPGGGPDTDDGWRMWHACVYEVGKAIAAITRDWSDTKWEEMTQQQDHIEPPIKIVR